MLWGDCLYNYFNDKLLAEGWLNLWWKDVRDSNVKMRLVGHREAGQRVASCFVCSATTEKCSPELQAWLASALTNHHHPHPLMLESWLCIWTYPLRTGLLVLRVVIWCLRTPLSERLFSALNLPLSGSFAGLSPTNQEGILWIRQMDSLTMLCLLVLTRTKLLFFYKSLVF